MKNVFDYIIVGAGSSGCVLANRLSENPKVSVLLIESGPADKNPLIHMPRGIGKMLTPGSPHVWDYKAAQGEGRADEDWLKGRTLGGSSSVNGMVYLRGHPDEYNDWEAAGCIGWGWKDIGRCYKAMEDHQLGEAEFRGAAGPLKITMHPAGDPLCEAVIAAAGEAGLPHVADLNASLQGGIGYQPRTIWRGRRQSAAKAFLGPVRSRRNLTIRTGTDVLRIIFRKKVAIGVEVRDKTGTSEIYVREELILSAGALNTPKLLQLSGVGPAEKLEELGIEVVADVPGVGQHLLEHRCILLQVRLKSGSLNQAFSGMGLAKSLANYFIRGKGPLTHAAHEVCGFFKTRPELKRPDAEIGVGLYSIAVEDGKIVLEKEPGMTWVGYFTNPDSQGSVMISSADPDAAVTINANYLATENDRRSSIAVLRFMRKILAQPALRDHIVAETQPGPLCVTDEQLAEAFFQFGSTASHAAGTCRMGADEASVVDPRLRVRGIDGLRVVDTSIMPTLITGNTNGPSMVMAMRAAEILIAERRAKRHRQGWVRVAPVVSEDAEIPAITA
ncbi:GMC family oxidoreductase [Glaciimonas sp. PCH181]|uniref:GMC family oxidoreductase n=1 Tax=Glaciimonas sp. PCH181 TaxID=2133943 RepID=UPI000D395E6B|nr:GMC family oxidoreductase N-terminal domain-containing protein [Glaciimonas sp. PCH181]PUA18573.1 oxidoreductase [Glaciimonas sp. PCH181]